MPLVNYIMHVCNHRDLGVPDRHGVYKTHLVGIGNGTETLEHYFHLSSRHLSNAWYMANQLGLKGPELDYLIESSVPVIVYASKQQVPGTILEFNLGKLDDTQYGLLVKYYQTYWEAFRKD